MKAERDDSVTWGLMLVLAWVQKPITRRLSIGLERSRWQNLLEIVVIAIHKQIEDVGLRQPQNIPGLSRHAVFICCG